MPTPPVPEQITGVILAGGLGRRMNHADKGLLPYQGRPLIEHVITRFAPQVGNLMVNANRNVDRYQSYGYPVVADVLPDFAGPLAGLVSAFAATASDWLVSVPCDVPELPADLVERLCTTHATHPAATIVFAVTDERAHPTFALLHRSIVPDLSDYLAHGERRVAVFYRTHHAVEARFPEEAAFRNCNTPDDLNN